MTLLVRSCELNLSPLPPPLYSDFANTARTVTRAPPHNRRVQSQEDGGRSHGIEESEHDGWVDISDVSGMECVQDNAKVRVCVERVGGLVVRIVLLQSVRVPCPLAHSLGLLFLLRAAPHLTTVVDQRDGALQGQARLQDRGGGEERRQGTGGDDCARPGGAGVGCLLIFF